MEIVVLPQPLVGESTARLLQFLSFIILPTLVLSRLKAAWLGSVIAYEMIRCCSRCLTSRSVLGRDQNSPTAGVGDSKRSARLSFGAPPEALALLSASLMSSMDLLHLSHARYPARPARCKRCFISTSRGK